jgi:hypothetical protein
VGSSATQEIRLVAQNFNVPDAREAIRREGEIQGIRVEKLEEVRRRFSTELIVTVTGEEVQIQHFRKSLRGSGPGTTPIDNIAGSLIDAGIDAARGQLRKRFGRGSTG